VREEFMNRRALNLLAYSLWTLVAAMITLGAAPLKWSRRSFGRSAYWALGTGLTVGLFVLGAKAQSIGLFSIVIMIGVFSEFEEMGFSFLVSAFFALVINALLAGGIFAFWISGVGANWSQLILPTIENAVQLVTQSNPRIKANAQDLMVQLPSVILMLWMGVLYLAVWLDRRGNALRAQLAEVRMPDPVVWIFVVSLLGAFGGLLSSGPEAVALNVLNVCFLLFFFQGLAVVVKFFESVRMGIFWQIAFLFLIVMNLFLVVSVLGLVDYWVDFRARMTKRAEESEGEA